MNTIVKLPGKDILTNPALILDRLILLEEKLENLSSQRKILSINTSRGKEIIQIDQIVYCSADSNYTNIHLIDHSKLIVSKTLKHIVEQLPKSKFIRSHCSYLVNRNHVRIIQSHPRKGLLLSNNKLIPISRGFQHQVSSYF